MSSNDHDEAEPAVHAASAAPEAESPQPPVESDIEIEETPDTGWDDPESGPATAASGDRPANPSSSERPAAPSSADEAPAPAPAVPAPLDSRPRQPLASNPVIVEAPGQSGPPGSDSAPPGSRRLAPPPKPRKSVPTETTETQDGAPSSDAAAQAAAAAYAAPMPTAPALPNFDSLVSAPTPAEAAPAPPSASAPPQPTSVRPQPPRPNSNPPPRLRSVPPGFDPNYSRASRPDDDTTDRISVPPDLQALTARSDSMPAISVGEASLEENDSETLRSFNNVLNAAASVAGTEDVTYSEPPPARRRSEPPAPPTHIVVPTDQVPSSPSKPMAAPAIHVMRIIAVGAPRAEPPPEIQHEELSGEDITEEEAIAAEGVAAPAAAEPEAEELSDDDVAPDSEREDAISIPPEEIESPEMLAKGEQKPPPPPRRPPPSQRVEGEARAEQPPVSSDATSRIKRQKRPWWEEMFGEDFVRAGFRVSDTQIAREVTFIEESLGVAPGGVVLDLGCGAGHHAVELASRGYGVVGYDLSLYQLALAAEVAQEKKQKLNFLQGDMREMAFEEMFDGIYCWNTTFGYFEEEKNVNVAQRVFRALKPGGMFLVDVTNRDFAASQSPSSLWFEGDSCVCMDDMNVDFIASRLRVKRAIILDDGRTKECSYSIRLYSLHELGKLLHDVGFRVTEASGHPAMPGVFFGQDSPRIIMLAQKP